MRRAPCDAKRDGRRHAAGLPPAVEEQGQALLLWGGRMAGDTARVGDVSHGDLAGVLGAVERYTQELPDLAAGPVAGAHEGELQGLRGAPEGAPRVARMGAHSPSPTCKRSAATHRMPAANARGPPQATSALSSLNKKSEICSSNSKGVISRHSMPPPRLRGMWGPNSPSPAPGALYQTPQTPPTASAAPWPGPPRSSSAAG